MAVSEDSDQPSPSNKTTTDDDHSLVLDLSKDDPLFEQKKKLLQEKGFSPTERVYFSSSSCFACVNTTLETLLHRARVIHLNETELYFGEMNIDPPEEFYSPRNELEALNFIISLIDISLENCIHEATSFLQDLRSAAVQKVCDFGEKYKFETRTVENVCDKEKLLLQWAQSNGVKSRLRIAYVEDAGRGALAVEDLRIGETALEIPVSMIISEDLVHESDMFHILEKIDGISAETMLLMWSMRERHDSNSKYKIYFDTFPENFNTGLSFGVESIVALEGTLAFEEICQAKEHLHSQYDKMFPALCDSHPEIFPPEFYTWDQYLWACELWYSNSMRVMFTDGSLRTCLIPVAGFLNHSICPHIMNYGKVDSSTNTLKFPLSRPCRAGEQCYLSYGNLSSSHLLIFYGFLPQGDNPYDLIPLEIISDQESCFSEEGYSTSDSTTHMVRSTWFSKNHGIFHYGLPTPLLNHLRKAQNPCASTVTRANLENELEVLETLRSIFDAMNDGFGPVEDHWESHTWDVKLAVNYLYMQRRIVSSNLNSCDEGSKMVKDLWVKCMAEDVRG
ncbi:hypothetical protein Nepgr_005823 [Nepenthes gracilis]|uniref:SET domain-containing protein n=1 Tax=Nepenthes gracilis TaxID=150966 RepID=A0AAD3S492_NEPGR|nr:hypothetical protein Nepgr_005823 [Nepenthes gracilis]